MKKTEFWALFLIFSPQGVLYSVEHMPSAAAPDRLLVLTNDRGAKNMALRVVDEVGAGAEKWEPVWRGEHRNAGGEHSARRTAP